MQLARAGDHDAHVSEDDCNGNGGDDDRAPPEARPFRLLLGVPRTDGGAKLVVISRIGLWHDTYDDGRGVDALERHRPAVVVTHVIDLAREMNGLTRGKDFAGMRERAQPCGEVERTAAITALDAN